jgi:pimeloyl-ACP methyl ester carboxylesterase
MAIDGLIKKDLETSYLGKRFSVQQFGQASGQDVVALHGWLDSSDSFLPLAKQLPELNLLAPDLAGHGLSDFRSPDAEYPIWDDVRDVIGLVDDLVPEDFFLMGHSRGAIISAMLAGVFPDRPKGLILLEGLWPMSIREDQAADQYTRFLHKRRKINLETPQRRYQNREDMIAVRQQAGFGLSEGAARMLTSRNVRQDDDGFYWGTDPRLNIPSPMMLTPAEADSFLEQIRCPILLVIAEQGMGKYAMERMEEFVQHKNVTLEVLPGGHHFHMEEQAETIAGLVRPFISTF